MLHKGGRYQPTAGVDANTKRLKRHAMEYTRAVQAERCSQTEMAEKSACRWKLISKQRRPPKNRTRNSRRFRRKMEFIKLSESFFFYFLSIPIISSAEKSRTKHSERGHTIGAAWHPDNELAIYRLLQEYLQLPSQGLVRRANGDGGPIFRYCVRVGGGRT